MQKDPMSVYVAADILASNYTNLKHIKIFDYDEALLTALEEAGFKVSTFILGSKSGCGPVGPGGPALVQNGCRRGGWGYFRSLGSHTGHTDGS